MFMKGTLILSNKWDIRFLEMAKLVASWSKDPSTQVGSVAVRNRTVIAQGYNGFPRGVDDHELYYFCLLYTSPSPRDRQKSRMPSSA